MYCLRRVVAKVLTDRHLLGQLSYRLAKGKPCIICRPQSHLTHAQHTLRCLPCSFQAIHHELAAKFQSCSCACVQGMLYCSNNSHFCFPSSMFIALHLASSGLYTCLSLPLSVSPLIALFLSKGRVLTRSPSFARFQHFHQDQRGSVVVLRSRVNNTQ